ncbi:CDP-diacylglycerol--serine O-phosphatidyltransferase [Sporosarcina sp. JAI121]|uniref:CDP-diacylglycerol--serine O-phosphatidyltransferase n=1 Tax=Sporosarcina sp. JAI121 TaxID=2723064 RepID=UPI0015C8053E|nr:CDP-diacylglycerol--serine O-phosphatidyltransferase [Sporosarcina sp. JAI121]NYF25427.1 CDP-diacylglycerol--serine O-phosphatidyltransferase [Sporosarcina sp. JAI121]
MYLPGYFEHSKIKAQLANAITLMNLSFGVFAIILILKGLGHMSLLFIFLAALFDRFDGMVARHYNAESHFGKELDSLCDLVSFGLAPALLIYETAMYLTPKLGIIVTVFYVLAGAVRLARYNSNEFDGAFYGVPITAAGVAMTLSYFLIPYLGPLFFVVLMLIMSVLMISNIRIAKV